MARFDRIFSIVIPKYSNAGERINTDKLGEFVKKMSREFGGATVIPSALGCWISERDELVCEENMIIESAFDASEHPDELDDKRRFVRGLAKEIGEELGQYSVMAYEDIIDRVEFIEGRYKEHIPEYLKEKDFFKKLLD
jgi:hypothetical protein